MHTGAVADSMRGEAASASAKSWCETFAFPKSKTFSIERYGYESCKRLSAEYCRHGLFFYKIWEAVGLPADFTHTVELLASIDDDVDFDLYLHSLPAGDPAIAKGTEMSNLAPAVYL